MILPRPLHSRSTSVPHLDPANNHHSGEGGASLSAGLVEQKWMRLGVENKPHPFFSSQKKKLESESWSQVGFTLLTKHQKRPPKIAKIFSRFTLFGSARCSSKVRIISTPKGLPRDKDTAATKGETPKPKVFGFGSQLNLIGSWILGNVEIQFFENGYEMVYKISWRNFLLNQPIGNFWRSNSLCRLMQCHLIELLQFQSVWIFHNLAGTEMNPYHTHKNKF